jgi:hypothetical protein
MYYVLLSVHAYNTLNPIVGGDIVVASIMNNSKGACNCMTSLELTRKLSQPHFGLSVRMKLTLPKVGTWSPSRLPKTQSSIAGVKTPCIGVFFIPLKRS